MRKIILLVLIMAIIQSDAFSQIELQKKYTLFNPVPRDKMRDMSTDRPDITENPNSVDAGHFQMETDLFKTSRSKNDGITSVENNYNLANLKLGLTHNTDLQLVVGSYVNSYDKDATGKKFNNTSGFGDLTIRIKHNLWGNDGGKTAFALMPYINLPTSKDNNAVEGGIIFPLSVDIGDGFDFGTQIQVDILKSIQSGYHTGLLQSIVVGKELSKSLETFVESYYNYDFENKKFDLSFNGGMGYSVTKNLKFDAGFNLGLIKNTDKVYFIGFSFRY
ncbi:transporter [Pedobacter boryungensis]|uniref:Transporter n=1 Tax=Pedobacter boryungensis TaxID=869962 RepID=A0ABX2DAT2_9SPHI|nr:transporter [Pedobacter boryungensis]NQX31172.1 transporter [Pedobacter boryungensis]